MHARLFNCTVSKIHYLNSETIHIGFIPNKEFTFEGGQFVSVMIPPAIKGGAFTKRCYSLSGSGYEICVKLVEGGIGSEFLRSLRIGDHFRMMAPFGDFQLKREGQEAGLCLIGTGTGIAPLKAILESKRFQESGLQRVTVIFGARKEEDILFREEFEKMGVTVVYALSQADSNWKGFRGRVTDYLLTIPVNFATGSTDFYICGNGNMVQEVTSILRERFRVNEKNIIRENFSPMVKPQERKRA